MNRLYLVTVPVMALALTLTGFVGGGSSAMARSRVICKIVTINGKKRVSCPKAPLHGKNGKKGARGAQGPAGPAGPPGATGAAGAGSGLTLNFNAKLGQPLAVNKTITINNFTVRVSAKGNGECENVELLTGDRAGLVSVGAGNPFSVMGAFSAIPILTTDTSNMFTAVSADGGSTVSGIVGRKFAGGFCLVSGYITGV